MTTMSAESMAEEKETPGPPQRIATPSPELPSEQIIQLWTEQDLYINYLEEKLANSTKESEDKTRQESTRREHLLVMRLTAKEQEIQELAAQVAELKSAQAPTSALLRSTLLDPAVNLLIQKLTKECENLKKQAEDKQNELAAWKFTPDSATGKRLMAKCRQLYQENEDLGKMIASGRLAKLEGELALQKNLSEQMKQNQLEMDDFMAELDEDVEGMQSTILYLQQQLRESKDELAKLKGNTSYGDKEEENPRGNESSEDMDPNKTEEEQEQMEDSGGKEDSDDLHEEEEEEEDEEDEEEGEGEREGEEGGDYGKIDLLDSSNEEPASESCTPAKRSRVEPESDPPEDGN